MRRSVLSPGTFCYVVANCRASPCAVRAVGRIVEVIAGPYTRVRGEGTMTCYDVRHEGQVFYCDAEKLRPINDPSMDVGEPQDGRLAM